MKIIEPKAWRTLRAEPYPLGVSARHDWHRPAPRSPARRPCRQASIRPERRTAGRPVRPVQLRRAAVASSSWRLAVYLVGVMSAVAFAHVIVTPDTAVQGGYAALTFRIPNERDDASTTEIEVRLPVDSPLASISVKPHPGWSYKITEDHPGHADRGARHEDQRGRLQDHLDRDGFEVGDQAG